MPSDYVSPASAPPSSSLTRLSSSSYRSNTPPWSGYHGDGNSISNNNNNTRPPPQRPVRAGSSRRLSRGPYHLNRTIKKQPLATRIVHTVASISRQLWTIFLRLPRLQQAAVAVALVCMPIVSVLFLIYSHQIFTWLGPVAKGWRELPGGWLIIWLMAFVSAFPPMIGYSTSMTLAGLVYGFPLGWPIAASATVAGSTAAFMTSRGIFSNYVHSLVGNDKRFVALGQVLRRDGLLVLTGVRFCPLPYSLSNGFLATIPTIRPWAFALATAFVSPKLLIHVFIGSRLALLAEEGDSMSTRDKVINYISMAVGGIVGASVGLIIYRRTMARAAELAREEAANGDVDGTNLDDEDDDEGRHISMDRSSGGSGSNGERSRLMDALINPDDAEEDAAALMDDDDISLWAADDFIPGAGHSGALEGGSRYRDGGDEEAAIEGEGLRLQRQGR